MKILLVLHELRAGSPGGVQAHVEDLSAELARRGHGVELLAGCEGHEASPVPPVAATLLARVPRRPGLGRFLAHVADPELESRFAEFVLQTAPDLVHIHHFMYLSIGLVETLRSIGVPFVVTLHDHGLFCHRLFLVTGDGRPCSGPGTGFACGPCNRGPGLRGWAAGPAFVLRTAMAARLAARIPTLVVPSRYLASFCEDQGLDRARIHVVPNGIRPAVKRDRGTGTPVQFAVAGTLRPHKGARVALEAFSLLERGQARLVVFGDAELEPDYGPRIAEDCGALGARLEPGFTRHHLDTVLAGVDCMLIPSLAVESSSLLARECLARGIPLLASRVGGLPEVAEEGRGVHYVEPGDTAALAAWMDRLSRRPSELEALAARCAEQPTVEAHVDQLEQLYRKAVEAGPA